MSNQSEPKILPPRKPYQKPRIEQVRLVIDQAVLGSGCKTPTSAGPYNGACSLSPIQWCNSSGT